MFQTGKIKVRFDWLRKKQFGEITSFLRYHSWLWWIRFCPWWLRNSPHWEEDIGHLVRKAAASSVQKLPGEFSVQEESGRCDVHLTPLFLSKISNLQAINGVPWDLAYSTMNNWCKSCYRSYETSLDAVVFWGNVLPQYIEQRLCK